MKSSGKTKFPRVSRTRQFSYWKLPVGAGKKRHEVWFARALRTGRVSRNLLGFVSSENLRLICFLERLRSYPLRVCVCVCVSVCDIKVYFLRFWKVPGKAWQLSKLELFQTDWGWLSAVVVAVSHREEPGDVRLMCVNDCRCYQKTWSYVQPPPPPGDTVCVRVCVLSGSWALTASM